MTHILLTFSDHSIGIMQYVPEDSSDDALANEISRSSFEKTVLSWKRIQPEDIPKDRTFRGAWTEELAIDMPKARDIYRETLRSARVPLFAKLDTEYIRADETGDNPEKARIAGVKQQLRDITDLSEIEQAQTPEDLKAFWPDVLEQD